jgi:hypothetical protein
MRPVIRISMLAIALCLASTPHAGAALVYAPAGCVLASPLFAFEGNACEGATGPGDPTSGVRGAAPDDEYIDPATNVVYRLDGDRLVPIGASLPRLGYVSVNAYRYGQVSGDPLADLDCYQGGEYCSPCPAVSFCASWQVALAGYHEMRVEMKWVNWPSGGCVPERVHERAEWDYSGGSPVTRPGRVYALMPPMSGCGVGDFTVLLFIDGLLAGRDELKYGPTDCAGGVDSFRTDTWVYVNACAPCESLRHGDTSDLCKVRPGSLTESLGV